MLLKKASKVGSILRNFVLGPNLTLQKPTVIQFPVIDICNSRCQMCRIWENKKSNDITVEQLHKGLKNGLFSEVTSIGFNGGEPTLREDLIELVKTVVNSLPKLKHVSLITNAYKYIQVNNQIEKMADLLNSKSINFDVMISLDGFEEVHDKVRGKTGNFENAKQVISYVKNNPKVNTLRIGCTVIKENALHLAPLLDFCINEDIYIKYRLGVPHQRLYTENLLDPYALTVEQKYEFVEFLEGLISYYEPILSQKYFYRSLINQIAHDNKRSAGCDWQHRGATITAKGELAYCAVKSKVLMENIADGDASLNYFSNSEHLNDIKRNDCDDCNHDYVGLPSKTEYRRQIIEKLKIKEKAKLLPGFTFINNLRGKYLYARRLENYRTTHIKHSINILSNNNKKIMICGWYGTETLGDKAIIAGVMHAFKESYGNDSEFYVVSLNKYITQITKRQMSEFNKVNVITVDEALTIVKNMNILTFGGGPLMAINDLAPMQVLFEKANKASVKTIISACGVGPFGNDYLNNSIRKILTLSDARIYRDERSLKYAKELGVSCSSDKVAEDPAFTWLAKYNADFKTNEVIKNSPLKTKTLLLGLRDFPYQDYARHVPLNKALELKANYERSIIESLESLVEINNDIIIKPLPMCTNHFGSDDRWFYRRLFRNNPKLISNLDMSLLGAEMPPLAYCKEFQEADALLAMRFHSLVFGIGLGVNCVAIDYTLGKGKVKSLAERFKQPLLSMFELDANKITQSIEKALNAEKIDPIQFNELKFLGLFNQSINKLDEL